MTTIAWDGKTLAADTRAVTHAGFQYGTVKIWRLSNGRLFGAAGDAEDCELARFWVEHEQGTRPELKGLAAILVTTDGRYHRYEEKMVGFPVTDPFHALGSGRDYAIAAMHYGKSAREAVELASIYDAYSGGSITELQLTPDAAP